MNIKFEVRKLKIAISKSGVHCSVKRQLKNDYNEPTDKFENVTEFKGLYHEQNSYINMATAESAQYVSKKIPMVLCELENVKDVKQNDILTLNGKSFKITGVANIQEWNLIADISLEVI